MNRILFFIPHCIFALLFSGCFSAMHPAQVTNGPSIALAVRKPMQELDTDLWYYIIGWGMANTFGRI